MPPSTTGPRLAGGMGLGRVPAPPPPGLVLGGAGGGGGGGEGGARARRERPCRCPAEQRDERAAATHSITSSARASSVGGTSRPSALAVCRLMTNSNLVDYSTGKSVGLTPLRIWPL